MLWIFSDKYFIQTYLPAIHFEYVCKIFVLSWANMFLPAQNKHKEQQQKLKWMYGNDWNGMVHNCWKCYHLYECNDGTAQRAREKKSDNNTCLEWIHFTIDCAQMEMECAMLNTICIDGIFLQVISFHDRNSVLYTYTERHTQTHLYWRQFYCFTKLPLRIAFHFVNEIRLHKIPTTQQPVIHEVHQFNLPSSL